MKARFRISYRAAPKKGEVYGPLKELAVTCASNFELFSALFKMRGRRRVLAIKVGRTPRAYKHLRPLAARDGFMSPPSLRFESQRLQEGCPPLEVITDGRLEETEKLEELACLCWIRAQWMARHSWLRPIEHDPEEP